MSKERIHILFEVLICIVTILSLLAFISGIMLFFCGRTGLGLTFVIVSLISFLLMSLIEEEK